MSTLGRNGSAPPFGVDVISATKTEECEVVDVSNRNNVGGATGAPGYRAYKAGFQTITWEIECHDASGLITSLQSNSATSGFSVMSVTENVSIDGAVTYTVTCRQL